MRALGTTTAIALVLGGAAAIAQNLTPPCPTVVASIGDCPITGCGGVADALLNTAKNRIDTPAAPVDITVADIKSLDQPTDWTTGQARTSIDGTEGWQVRLVARLKIVKKEGKETCNCGLSKQADTDVHLVMVDRLADDESESISAELTPRVRADGHHTKWIQSQLLQYQGKLVRLTGWVMLDTAHVHHAHLLPGEHPVGPVNRSTDWEVHPVTKFEVCASTIAKCRAGVGWRTVD